MTCSRAEAANLREVDAAERRHAALWALLHRLDREDGPLGEEDEAEIRRVGRALRGADLS